MTSVRVQNFAILLLQACLMDLDHRETHGLICSKPDTAGVVFHFANHTHGIASLQNYNVFWLQSSPVA